jgi:DNA-binding PadR family transcriptional regulator
MSLTKKERFCLSMLWRRDCYPREIARQAKEAGINTAALTDEWAATPLRTLRGAGYAEYTGKCHMKQKIHRITHAGRKALEDGE